jgi:GGDEF domain-containing protein
VYRPKKEPENNRVVLPKLDALPAASDLDRAVQQAQQSQGKWVELFWDRENSRERMTLAVMLRHGGGAPVWVLKEGEFKNIVELWTYETGDTALVHNLTVSECTGSATAESALLPAGMTPAAGGSASFTSGLLNWQTSSSSKMPALSLEQSKAPATMEGQLADMPMPNLLQSCSMGKMTGRLLVHDETTAVEMYFDEGNLLHATAGDASGDDVILDVVGWNKGKFYFYRDQKTEGRSVERRLDAMLMEGLTLFDQTRTIAAAGLAMDMILDKKNKLLTEGEFEKIVAAGAPVDMHVQKQMYLAVDGTSSLGEILSKSRLSRRQWVPIFYNFVRGDLLIRSQVVVEPDKTSYLVPAIIDRSAIDSIDKSFRRPDSGLVSYPHFQYLLEQEMLRSQLHRTQFSVVVLDLWRQFPAGAQPMSAQSLKTVFERMHTVKRQLDVIAHFEALSYALLLPHTETAAAAILAYRIREALIAGPIGDMPINQFGISCGVAGVPEDCRDMGILLAAAKAAKQAAQINSTAVVLFKDLEQNPSAPKVTSASRS